MKLLLVLLSLLAGVARADQANDKLASDNALYADTARQLFAKAVLLKDAPVIEDSGVACGEFPTAILPDKKEKRYEHPTRFR